jgi:hypothetical protein
MKPQARRMLCLALSGGRLRKRVIGLAERELLPEATLRTHDLLAISSSRSAKS